MRVIERGYIFIGTPIGIMAINVEVFESGVGGFMLPGEAVTSEEESAICAALGVLGYVNTVDVHPRGYVRTLFPSNWIREALLDDVESAAQAIMTGGQYGN